MEYGTAAAQVAAEASTAPQESKKARSSGNQEPAQPALTYGAVRTVERLGTTRERARRIQKLLLNQM